MARGGSAGHGAPSSSECGAVGDEAILGGHLDTASTRFASAGGPAGQTGPTGVRGAAGPAGARGPRGPAGKIELVTCTISKKTAGHKPTKRCTAKLVSRVVTFKTGEPQGARTIDAGWRSSRYGPVMMSVDGVVSVVDSHRGGACAQVRGSSRRGDDVSGGGDARCFSDGRCRFCQCRREGPGSVRGAG